MTAAESVYRAELIHTTKPAAWADEPGWLLYLDGRLVAHTSEQLAAAGAQGWANAQLGEGVVWLPGTESGWYWVAGPNTTTMVEAIAARHSAILDAGDQVAAAELRGGLYQLGLAIFSRVGVDLEAMRARWAAEDAAAAVITPLEAAR